MGAVNQLNRFIPNLAQLCFKLRPLLKQDKVWCWTESHDKAFEEINKQVKKLTEVGHFKKSGKIRIICDASKAGLGAVLQQQEEIGWRPIHFASRFLTPLEEKYSINELELLAVVWAVEHFKNYLYGIKFQVVSDHKALATVLKSNKGNKTYSSRLTRWVDRLLPFDFEIFHAPGRTIGIADYLSRHPSPIEGTSVKAEELWNNWFTVNHVNNVNSILAEEFNGPIRGRHWIKLRRDDERSKSESIRDSFKARNTLQFNNDNKMGQTNLINTIAGNSISQKFESKLPIANKIGENLLIANYKDDENLQKIINLVKNPTKAKIKALDSPWRERFTSLSLDENDLLYLDDRLIIPKVLQTPIKNSLHWGHPGRDQMLRQISDIWWPRIHRDITLLTKSCLECQNAGKSIKPLLKQKQFGKLPTPITINEEIAIDFAGPFKIARSSKKYLIVSVDSKSGWPDAKFLSAPTTSNVIEFLTNCIVNNGIPRRIRTDPGTAFKSKKFQSFCRKYFIEHIICPIYDHRGNGKVERLIRTINERLRTNKTIVLDKENTGLSEQLYALRTAPKENKLSPAELHTNRKFTTVKDIITTKPQPNYNVSDKDSNFELEMSDFPADQDSEILVRERARGSKLEETYKKKKGRIINETPHTLKIKERGKSLPTLLSKREVATSHKLANLYQTAQTNNQSQDANIDEPNKTARPKKSNSPTSPKKKQSKKIPTEFKRLANWQDIFFESEDEEETIQKRKTTPNAIKATVNWGTTKIEPTETIEEQNIDTDNEPSTSTGERRSQRSRRAPQYYGDTVMICDVEKSTTMDKPEIINISSSEDSLR